MVAILIDVGPARLVARRETSVGVRLQPVGPGTSVPFKPRAVARVGATVVPTPDLAPIPWPSATAATVASARPVGPSTARPPPEDMAIDGFPVQLHPCDTYQWRSRGRTTVASETNATRERDH